ncbi:double-strand break repair protein AddB [Notoacmeibacter sp. MSK16QG-6]|uniref:double-strand break repair protein AddB n=1 Tax=Notoacmeibacter sp. MSK16QG-6 TaxID=2957982 RepID=UPI00209FDBA6|nr:double-strand break repair protein AddB [Notoacmeibacter sp. MSK16QG-6]MCP1199013.1 double-strand break repair protein AddB [Notoacmeibacter sp. MSK16QG-6]
MADRVFTIDPGLPFLPTLADALFDGSLTGEPLDKDDPFALSSVTLFLPTRRAARSLRAHLLDRADGRPVMMPAIRTLGDPDEDAGLIVEGGAHALDLKPPADPMHRTLVLAPLVQKWRKLIAAEAAQRGGPSAPVPATLADAIYLASDLGRLIDEVETEGIGWDDFKHIVPDELADWWRITLQFLTIVTEAWPTYLTERDLSNPADHTNRLLDALAARLVASPPNGPVIAAGSTGTNPVTRRLLAAIASLPRGAIVLPGLDRHVDDDAWSLLSTAAVTPALYGHPQQALATLLRALDTSPADVRPLGAGGEALHARGKLVSLTMIPAPLTDRWKEKREAVESWLKAGALDNVSLIEAASEQDEAMAIAAALRAAIETPNHQAALITPDRALARRVSSELLRFGIIANDSGGTPLETTPPATLLLLTAECAFRPGQVLPLLALLKHPLLRLGEARAQLREMAEFFELLNLRGTTARPDVARLNDLLDDIAERRGDHARERPDKRYDSRRASAGLPFGHDVLGYKLQEAFEPLTKLRGNEFVPLHDILVATVQVFEALGRQKSGALDVLYDGENGAMLAAKLRRLVGEDSQLSVTPNEWPDVLAALLAGETVKPAVGADQRVFIWGQLESRLQTVQTVILGALNEKSWPAAARADRFLSRSMQTDLSLLPPERRIGYAAHDFQQAMGHPTVILSRSAKADGAPTVSSRWLQRLTVLAGSDATDAMRQRGATYLSWGSELDRAALVPLARRPCPIPPIEDRPTAFSVTQIERLRRDPYAIYAERILGLRPLPELMRDHDARDRGTLFHAILETFVKAGIDLSAKEAAAHLEAIGRKLFAAENLPDDIHAVWWPRFMAMVPHVLALETERQGRIVRSHVEAKAAETAIDDTGCTLRGTADRIDEMLSGGADLIDYKTGEPPSAAEVRALTASQLPLEAALLQRGAFAGPGAKDPADLLYIKLAVKGEVTPKSALAQNKKQVVSASDLADQAWERLVEQMLFYRDPAHGYVARLLPFRQDEALGDYDHLARTLEWSAGTDSETG